MHYNSGKPSFSTEWLTTAVAVSSLGTLMQPMTEAGSYVARHTHDGQLLAVAVNQTNTRCSRLVFVAYLSSVVTVADMHGMGTHSVVTNNPRSVVLSLLIISLAKLSFRVTTCPENLEMSGNLTSVRELSGILLKIMEMSGICQGKNLVREKLPKTVYCKLHICVHTGI